MPPKPLLETQLPPLLWAGMLMAPMAVSCAYAVAGTSSVINRVTAGVIALALLLHAHAVLASPLPGTPWAPIPAVCAAAWMAGSFVILTRQYRFSSEAALTREASLILPTDPSRFRLPALFVLASATAVLAASARHWLNSVEGSELPAGASLLLSVVMGLGLAVGGLSAAWLAGRDHLSREHAIGLTLLGLAGIPVVEWTGGLFAHLGDSAASWSLGAAPFFASLKGSWTLVHLTWMAACWLAFAAARRAGLHWVWWPLIDEAQRHVRRPPI